MALQYMTIHFLINIRGDVNLWVRVTHKIHQHRSPMNNDDSTVSVDLTEEYDINYNTSMYIKKSCKHGIGVQSHVHKIIENVLYRSDPTLRLLLSSKFLLISKSVCTLTNTIPTEHWDLYMQHNYEWVLKVFNNFLWQFKDVPLII